MKSCKQPDTNKRLENDNIMISNTHKKSKYTRKIRGKIYEIRRKKKAKKKKQKKRLRQDSNPRP